VFADLVRRSSLLAVLLLGCGGAAAEDHPPVAAERAPLAAQGLLVDVARAGRVLIAVGEHGIILASEDEGKTWTQRSSPVDVLLTAVTFADDQHGLAVGHDGVILKTGDGGRSWQLVQRDLDAGPFLTVALAADGQHGVAGGAYGLLLATADGGTTWHKAKVADDAADEDADGEGADSHLYASALPAPDRWIVVGEAGRIITSSDQGATWKIVKPPYSGSYFGILARTADDWLIYGLEGKMFETADAGATWTEIQTEETSSFSSAALLADGRLVVVRRNGTILVEDKPHGEFHRRHPEDAPTLTAVMPVDGGAILLSERGVIQLDQTMLRAAP
jgi:photosystem II stability/assembly factor-like uncharacterized protein